MTDSQNEFAYSQVRDLVNKSIKSNGEENNNGNVYHHQGNRHAMDQAKTTGKRRVHGAGNS